MLEAIMGGSAIEIMPTDDLKAFQEVFEGFMRTAPYYQLAPELQDYIRDVLVAVSTYGKEDEQFMEQELQRTVFPRVPQKPANAAQNMTAVSSPQAAEQMAGEFESLDQRRAISDDAKPVLSRAPKMGGVS